MITDTLRDVKGPHSLLDYRLPMLDSGTSRDSSAAFSHQDVADKVTGDTGNDPDYSTKRTLDLRPNRYAVPGASSEEDGQDALPRPYGEKSPYKLLKACESCGRPFTYGMQN